jgi:hypothetical protein
VSLIKLRLDKLNASEEHEAESREVDGGERNEASGKDFEIHPSRGVILIGATT